MVDNKIILSICIPTYNRVDKLRRTVSNLMTQIKKVHGGGIELLISNNASTDETQEYLQTLKEIDFIRVNNNEQNLGYGGNVKLLMNMVRGQFFQILSDDDVYFDDLIQIELDTLLREAERINYAFVAATWTKSKAQGWMSRSQFFQEFSMASAACGTNIFRTALARKITIQSDTWLHCDLLFNMNPMEVFVFKPLIDMKMPGAEDKSYWHNQPATVVDYDTEIILIINKANLAEDCKDILLDYYKGILKYEIIRWRIEAKRDEGRKFAGRLAEIPKFAVENELLSISYNRLIFTNSFHRYLMNKCVAFPKRCFLFVKRRLNKIRRW